MKPSMLVRFMIPCIILKLPCVVVQLYYYEHDLNIETSEVAFNEKGQPMAVNLRSLSEVLAEV